MIKNGSPHSTRFSWKRLWIHHLMEILGFCALLILFRVMFIIEYEPFQKRMEIARVHQQIVDLVYALQVYSLKHPLHEKFAPGTLLSQPGIILTPLQDPLPSTLTFLTTPVAYLPRIPGDPYTTEALDAPSHLTPIVLHWIKPHYGWEEKPGSYEHVGWGALSIGPSLQIPPSYEISALRRVPYESLSLSRMFYDPSNGLESIGLLYYDTFGNSSPL